MSTLADRSASELVRDNIRNLRAYQPGKPIEEVEREIGITGAIKIASNENPLGPSPLAIEAASRRENRAVVGRVMGSSWSGTHPVNEAERLGLTTKRGELDRTG